MSGRNGAALAVARDLRDRRPTALVSPRYEDAGLFKSDICNVEVDLTPVTRRNSRSDLIVTGYAGGRHKVPIVFAGRRMPEAQPLLALLSRLRGGGPGQRLKVQIEGAWRRVVKEDGGGFAQRRYELIAACWSVPTPGGRVERYGLRPAE